MRQVDRYVKIAACLALAAALTACTSARDRGPVYAVGAACEAYMIGLIDAGYCDAHRELDDCPVYVAAMAECSLLLRAAAQAEAGQ